MITIETPIQIRFSDVDMLGHVNVVNIQNYFDLGKTHFVCEVLGISFERSEQGMVQRASNIVYEAQSFLNEELVVLTKIEKLGTKSITFAQELLNKQTNELKARCTATLVAFNFVAQESIEVPQSWREKLAD